MSPLISNTTKLLAQWSLSAWKSATSPWWRGRIPFCSLSCFVFVFVLITKTQFSSSQNLLCSSLSIVFDKALTFFLFLFLATPCRPPHCTHQSHHKRFSVPRSPAAERVLGNATNGFRRPHSFWQNPNFVLLFVSGNTAQPAAPHPTNHTTKDFLFHLRLLQNDFRACHQLLRACYSFSLPFLFLIFSILNVILSVDCYLLFHLFPISYVFIFFVCFVSWCDIISFIEIFFNCLNIVGNTGSGWT